MTAPTLPSDGKPIVLPAGHAPVLITEYAPPSGAMLINTGTDRVWIGSTSTPGPSNGVPIEGGTAAPIEKAGPLWAAPDPAATTTVTLILTANVSDWQPSPAAIGVQVATQLLNNGIPNVFVGQSLAALPLLNPNASRQLTGMNKYASVQLIFSNVRNIGTGWWEWRDSASGLLVSTGYFEQEFVAGANTSGGQFAVELPVRADTLTYGFGPSVPLQIDVYAFASNRPVPGERVINWETSHGTGTIPVATLQTTVTTVINTIYVLGTMKSNGRPAMARMFASAAGWFHFLATDGLGNQSATALSVVTTAASDTYYPIQLPPGNLQIQFTAKSAVTNATLQIQCIQQTMGSS